MPRPPEDIRRRLEELITRARQFLPPRNQPDGGTTRQPITFSAPKSELWRFLISAIQTVISACGRESPHLRELERCRECFAANNGNGLDLDSCLGALEAARDDLAAGMLADLRQLVSAEAFGDLLETAVHLLDEGHHLPAASIAGAVLESTLRDTAQAKKVTWTGSSSISKLNTELYKANVYDKVVFGEIEAWGKLRNKVDHGDFTTPHEIDVGMVRRMIDGVRDIALKYR